jgi:SAM-dependent methyltransferase
MLISLCTTNQSVSPISPVSPISFTNPNRGDIAVSNAALHAKIKELEKEVAATSLPAKSLDAGQKVIRSLPGENSQGDIAALHAKIEELEKKVAETSLPAASLLSPPATNLGAGQKVIGRSLPGENSQAALKHVLANGWASSEVHVTNDQHHRNDKCFYQGNCNLNGENLLGRCFCLPGFTGVECGETDTTKPECTNNDDKCFYTEEAGVFAISLSRWHMAQEAELAMWNGNAGKKAGKAGTGDRIDEHLVDFNNYVSIGADGSDLGNFIEVGTGPWTQSLTMMKKRGFNVNKYVILEPGAINYAANTPGTVYRDGQIEGFDGKTVVINAGGEHLDLFYEAFDTVMIVNVLEHVLNGASILRNLYNALKPGGLLIFQDRWWDQEGPPGSVRADMDMDVLFHPIRMTKVVFEQFLSGFDVIYERRDEDVVSFHTGGRNYEGTYFIGRKKMMQC